MVSDAYCILEGIYIHSGTPIRLLTLEILHATMRKTTYDWVRCLLT